VTDYCGICGQPLRVVNAGATAACCPGGWYWHDEPPLPRDNLHPVRRDDIVVAGGRKFWLYRPP
jgi:hypothetical protein